MRFIYYILLSCMFFSCDKQAFESPRYKTVGESVDIYLIDDYDKIGQSWEIDESSVILNNSPIIPYEKIQKYDQKEYVFYVDQEIVDELVDNSVEYYQKAFAITVDDEVVYTGYFWYMYSSLICNWLTIDPIRAFNSNKLYVQLAYPENSFSENDLDRRNDQRIIDVLKKDRKLISK